MRFAIIQNATVVAVAISNSNLAEPNEIWVSLAGVNPEPGIGWGYANGVFTAPVNTPGPAIVYKTMTTEAFWDRFTQAERVDFEVACQHDPAATNAAKKDAAKMRLFRQDIATVGRVNPSKNKIRNFVIGLEGAVLAAGRATIILDTPITAAETF